MTTPARRLTVLVAGGNGFIGSHVVDTLRESGHRVRVLSSHPELFRPPLSSVAYHFGRVELGADLEAALDGCDAVVDAISQSVPASANQNPAASVAATVGTSSWLAELVRRHDIGAHIYLSSGGTVYGPSSPGRASSESDPLAPIGVYGAAKAATEIALQGILYGTGVRHTALRITNAYGERQNPSRPQGIVGVAMSKIGQDDAEPLRLFGDAVRDFVHAQDVGAAVVRCLEAEATGVYNVGSGAGASMSEVLGLIGEIAGAPVPLERQPARDFDVERSVVDIDRLTALGWQPRIGLREGLERTWVWHRSLKEA